MNIQWSQSSNSNQVVPKGPYRHCINIKIHRNYIFSIIHISYPKSAKNAKKKTNQSVYANIHAVTHFPRIKSYRFMNVPHVRVKSLANLLRYLMYIKMHIYKANLWICWPIIIILHIYLDSNASRNRMI